MNARQLGGARAVLAFGSNLGNRGETIVEAMSEIARLPGVETISESSLYETVAVKLHGIDPDAPAYLNAASIVFTTLEQSDDTLTLPHPRAWQRDFVLAPWLELDPDATIPGRGRVDELLASTDDTARRTPSETM